MQKPNVEAEVYNNSKQCDWGGTKAIDNYNRGPKKKKEKNPKEPTEQVKT